MRKLIEEIGITHAIFSIVALASLLFVLFSGCSAYGSDILEESKGFNKQIPDVPSIDCESLLTTQVTNPIDEYIIDVCSRYSNVDVNLIRSIVYHESGYNAFSVNYNGTCVGLMQIYTKYHMDRAARLGVTDFFDPYSNILLGVDYISELTNNLGDIRLVLMTYNMGYKKAYNLYSNGTISGYAKSVLATAEGLEEGTFVLPEPIL